MSKYSVTLPISGSATVEVEAESEDAALKAAIDAVTKEDIDDWQAHEALIRGNVFYGDRREADVTQIDGEPEATEQ